MKLPLRIPKQPALGKESNEVFLSKKSHLINLLKGAQPLKETSKSYPLLFLNIIIGKQTLFLRDGYGERCYKLRRTLRAHPILEDKQEKQTCPPAAGKYSTTYDRTQGKIFSPRATTNLSFRV